MQSRVTFREALRFWIQLGWISFGGPAGQIAILHRETVERRKWIEEERFLSGLNFCMLLPGPEAQQLATYIGWRMHGIKGALAAGGFFVIPSIFVLLALSWIYVTWGQVAGVAAVLNGFKPVVVAIVAEAVLRIGRRALNRRWHFAIAAAAFVALHFFRVPFPIIVLAAALIPGSAKVQWARPDWRPVAIGLLLWSAPFFAIVLWFGWNSLFAELYRFFTLAALVTFGGAYAVLAYVTSAAVRDFGWITAAQAVDGLALAETTPGPLIMVLQFVGFQAAWNRTQSMEAAVFAGLLVTYVTFLPSFVMVLAGAPLAERLQPGALAGITAAVTGVVLHLAVVFGGEVLTDLFSVVIAAAAFLALWRWKVNVVWIIVAGGAAGATRMALASWIQM